MRLIMVAYVSVLKPIMRDAYLQASDRTSSYILRTRRSILSAAEIAFSSFSDAYAESDTPALCASSCKAKSDHTLLLGRQKEQKNHRISGFNMLQIMLHEGYTPLQAQKEKASNYLYSKKIP